MGAKVPSSESIASLSFVLTVLGVIAFAAVVITFIL